jgi:hypothetical protein
MAANATDRDMNDNATPDFLTLKEFVEHSHLSESTVRRRVREGTLTAVQLGGKGKKLLFPADVLTRVNDQIASAEANAQTEILNSLPSTGTQAEIPAGPRPSWARKLARRPK